MWTVQSLLRRVSPRPRTDLKVNGPGQLLIFEPDLDSSAD